MSDRPRAPSRPEMKAFVAPLAGRATAPKRSPETNEAILERATAKLEALSDHFDRMLREAPTKRDVQECYREARQARRLLEEHLKNEHEDRRATNQRLDGIMGLLGEVLSRLPAPTIEPVPETQPSGKPNGS